MEAPYQMVSPNQAARNQVFAGYRWKGKWDLSDTDFDRITSEPCFYCGTPPSNTSHNVRGGIFTYSGIDRLDSDQGYFLDNVVPCCQWCNKGKLDREPDEFISHCHKVVTYQQREILCA